MPAAMLPPAFAASRRRAPEPPGAVCQAAWSQALTCDACRRHTLQPFLSLAPSSGNFSALHFQSALNRGAEAVEAVLGRRLFPFR